MDTKVSKSKNILLVLLTVIGVAIIGVGAFMMMHNKESVDNDPNDVNNGNESTKVIYYDDSRELQDTYTFKEAISKFAFPVNETTLIFEANAKTTFDSIMRDKSIYNDAMNPKFNYEQDIDKSLGVMYLGESNATTLEEFETNFKQGILTDNTKWTVEDVNIIDSNEEYVFASWTNKATVTTYEYYFAKIIGTRVYYAYYSSPLDSNKEDKISKLLEEFKDLFTCLSEDDGKEPYIYDKIMNVPVALNKQIKDVNLIYGVLNSNNDYLDGSVTFTLPDVSDFINLEYNADRHYDNIAWEEELDSNVTYFNEDGVDFLGMKEDNITQILKITNYSNTKFTTVQDFNNYINKFLINR